MTSQFDESIAKKHGVRAIAQNSQTTSDRLKRLKEYAEKGIVAPHIDKIFPLKDVSV